MNSQETPSLSSIINKREAHNNTDEIIRLKKHNFNLENTQKGKIENPMFEQYIGDCIGLKKFIENNYETSLSSTAVIEAIREVKDSIKFNFEEHKDFFTFVFNGKSIPLRLYKDLNDLKFFCDYNNNFYLKIFGSKDLYKLGEISNLKEIKTASLNNEKNILNIVYSYF